MELLDELEAAQEEVSAAALAIAGPIRLTAPQLFGSQYLAPLLARFAMEHAMVELDIVFDDRLSDMNSGGFDLAIRIGRLRDSNLIARRLATVQRVVLASPGYLKRRGRPAHPTELNDHDLLVYTNAGRREQWDFDCGNERLLVRGEGRLRSDSGSILRDAAIEGLGLTILPRFIALSAIESGTLEIVLTDFPVDSVGLYAVTPPSRAKLRRIRRLVEFLETGLPNRDF